MSEAMNPMSSGAQMSPARTASPVGDSATTPVAMERPGLVTFAAIMLFVAGAFSVVWAIQEITTAVYIKNNLTSYGYGNMTGYLWAWAILDLVLAAVAIYAGVSLLRGGGFGLVVGLIIAGVSAVRWFFYIPLAPWTAIAIIAIDILIIYGLVANTDYFESSQPL